jgi:SAM-dependent methyltransferase
MCPACSAPLSAESDPSVRCQRGHEYPVIDGVPSLIASKSGDVIRRSFSLEWAQFDYDEDRTWGATPGERVETFLRQLQLNAADLEGKRVLDAGCGNAVLSNALTSVGCDVVAVDVSDSVFAAKRRFRNNPSLHLIQANLMTPIFQQETFDVIYSGGVLHHTPDTREALTRVTSALAPGGRIFVWLYWRVPGRSYAVRSILRRAMAPLPLGAKHALVLPIAAVSALRHSGQNLSWRERVVIELDFFTPKYRWEHTPDEVAAWFSELGMKSACTDEVKDGFGVLAMRPA